MIMKLINVTNHMTDSLNNLLPNTNLFVLALVTTAIIMMMAPTQAAIKSCKIIPTTYIQNGMDLHLLAEYKLNNPTSCSK